MARSRKKSSVWPKLLLVGCLCLAAGAALAMLIPTPGSKDTPNSGPGPSAPRDRIASSVEGLTRSQLEDEVKRLERIVAEKEATITELTIQLKLAGK